MSQQVINTPQFGAADRRVIEMFTPINEAKAPDRNAQFIGQVWIDTDGGDVYVSLTTDADPKINDWVLVGGVPANKFVPITEEKAPDANADFIGQVWVDTDADNVYVAIKTDSEPEANDWVLVSGDEDKYAPIVEAKSPDVNAQFKGQVWVDTDADNVYVAKSTNEATPSEDWLQVNNV